MTKAVNKMFLGKYTEAWYQLSAEDQDRVWAGVTASIEKLSIKNSIVCDCSWSTEQWSFFGVQEYPDIEAVQKHAQDLTEIEWFRYVNTSTVLGTKND